MANRLTILAALAASLAGPLGTCGAHPAVPVLASAAGRGTVGADIRWLAAPAPHAVGFYLEREAAPGVFHRVAAEPVPCRAESVEPAWYTLFDAGAGPEAAAVYRVVTLAFDGSETPGAPFTVQPLQAGPAPAASPVVPLPVSAAGQAAPGARVKIAVSESGLYELAASNLAACLAGADVAAVTAAIASGGLRLARGSNEVAWCANPAGDGLWFYGVQTPSVFTTQTVYWLEPGPGLTMARGAVAPADPAVEGVFAETLHAEGETHYNTVAYTDPAADIWYWGLVRAPATNGFTVTVPSPAAGGLPARLTVNLKGSTELNVAGLEHHARVRVNGQIVGACDWGRLEACRPTFTVTNLVDGSNTVTVEAFVLPGDPALASFLVESFDLAYDRVARATNDSLAFTPGAPGAVTVGGFPSLDISLFDLTVPDRPVKLDGATVSAQAGGPGAISFVPASPTNRYLAAARARQPDSLTGRPVPTWACATNRADYVVIAPALLRGPAEDWAAYRRGQGLVSVVVDVEDLYDEFAHGEPTPQAIRAFLGVALRTWALAPRFVCLAGAGNLDYRNIKRLATDPCLIPPVVVATPFGLFGTDAPLADVDGDRVPDIALGRLPVIDTNECLALLAKTRAYETGVTNHRTVMAIADYLHPTDGQDFPAGSDSLLPRFPGLYGLDLNYSSPTGVALVRSRLLDSLNAGQALLTYVGHANDQMLANEGILAGADVASLTNRDSAPVLLAMTCLFGRFDLVMGATGTLAKRLVRRSTGGLSAVWSCASPSVNADNVRLGDWMLRALFRRPGLRLGSAHVAALAGFAADGAPAYVLDTYGILGDPALDPGAVNGEPATWESWRQAAFTTGQLADPDVSGPAADPDGDGLTNAQEREAGTQPLNRASRLEVGLAMDREDGPLVIWAGVSNRLYAVEWAPRVEGPYAPLARRVWDAAVPAVAETTGFYRVRTDE